MSYWKLLATLVKLRIEFKNQVSVSELKAARSFLIQNLITSIFDHSCWSCVFSYTSKSGVPRMHPGLASWFKPSRHPDGWWTHKAGTEPLTVCHSIPSGHVIFEEPETHVLVKNSWGTNCGRNGYAWIKLVDDLHMMNFLFDVYKLTFQKVPRAWVTVFIVLLRRGTKLKHFSGKYPPNLLCLLLLWSEIIHDRCCSVHKSCRSQNEPNNHQLNEHIGKYCFMMVSADIYSTKRWILLKTWSVGAQSIGLCLRGDHWNSFLLKLLKSDEIQCG